MTPRRLVLIAFAVTLTAGLTLQESDPPPATPDQPSPIFSATLPVSTAAFVSASPTAAVAPAAKPAPPRVYQPDAPVADVVGRRASDRFADVPLVTHEGEPVQFVRDLIRDRMVVINLTYTRCRGSCPATNSRIVQLRKALGPVLGMRVTFLSITVEPEYDTPEVLARFADRFSLPESPDLPPWILLSGAPDDIEELRYSLGLFDPDPVVDADPTKHAGLFTFGNDRTDRWAAIPSEMNSEEIAQTIVRIVGETRNERYAVFYADRLQP